MTEPLNWEIVSCAMCTDDIFEKEVMSCKCCYNPFCPRCYAAHYHVGYHKGIRGIGHDDEWGGDWVNDGLYRPSTSFRAYTLIYGTDHWLPSLRPVSWGDWRPWDGKLTHTELLP